MTVGSLREERGLCITTCAGARLVYKGELHRSRSMSMAFGFKLRLDNRIGYI